MKCAILGAGLCGLASCWHLLHQDSTLQIDVFDSHGIGGGASAVSSGLLYPYAGKQAKKNWGADEGFQASQDLIAQMNASDSLLLAKGIWRPVLHKEQESPYRLSVKKYPEDILWLPEEEAAKRFPQLPPRPGIFIPNALTVHCRLYLEALWKDCTRQGAQLLQQPISTLKELQNYDTVIIALGYDTVHLHELQHLKLTAMKGQALTLRYPPGVFPLSASIIAGIHLTPSATPDCLYLGATYERHFETSKATPSTAIPSLLARAQELLPSLEATQVVDCYAGIRAASPNQHLPLVQRLNSSHWLITGMGSKGLLYHAWLGKSLAQAILKGDETQIPERVRRYRVPFNP